MNKEKVFTAQEKYNALRRKMKWLDKNPRAACFYFFYIARSLSRPEAEISQSEHLYERNPLSAKDLGMEEISLGVEKNKTASLTVMAPQVNLSELSKDRTDKEIEINESLGRILNTELASGSENATLGKMSISKKIMPAGFFYANGIYTPFMQGVITGTDNIIERIVKELFDKDVLTRRKLIKEINIAWAQAISDFPEAFSWLDINDEKQCLWVWDIMKKKAVAPPANPINNIQRWQFICATFDLWEGWTHEQLSYLKAGRKKMSQNFSDLLSFPQSSHKHKAVLMDELEKAWNQKLFRRQVKENNTEINLSVRVKKKLARLSEIYGESESVLVASLIEDEYAGLMVKTEKAKKHS
ncbi:hypothetical protein SJ554_00295 [Enterobacter asburiae]|uniref:hypothetical protein n=1 Tax=Enterobacter asburiae TaxID=61645 RepID=UPI0029D648B0|nr:hypothetical protein [Enterobacter asburiae]MDX7660897.1 hypothetical protein [Enterobacter asburiae]